MAASTCTFVISKVAGVQGVNPDVYTIKSTTNSPSDSVEWKTTTTPTSQGILETQKAAIWDELQRQASLAT